MSFKRKYYADGGLKTKKRKLSHGQPDDEDDHILAGIAVCVAYEILR